MSLKQAFTLAVDWLDHETANIAKRDEGEDSHDALREAGVAFELSTEEAP